MHSNGFRDKMLIACMVYITILRLKIVRLVIKVVHIYEKYKIEFQTEGRVSFSTPPVVLSRAFVSHASCATGLVG